MKKNSNKQKFVLCIENKDCEDLEKRKIYKVIPDAKTEKEEYLRIVDESGQDYLYPKSYFFMIELPYKAQNILQMV